MKMHLKGKIILCGALVLGVNCATGGRPAGLMLPACGATLSGSGSYDDPVTAADGSGEEPESWMPGLLFAPDCTFSNLSGVKDKELLLIPVYKAPLRTVHLDLGTENSGTDIRVNYHDSTADPDRERILYEEETELSELMEGRTDEKEGYALYYWSFPKSEKNKRLFPGGEMPEGAGNVLLRDAVFDYRGSDASIRAVWVEGDTPAGWSGEQREKLSGITAPETGFDAESYRRAFGGDVDSAYGSISLTKKIEGADNVTYRWKITDQKGNAVFSDTSETFVCNEVTAGMNGYCVCAEISLEDGGDTCPLCTENLIMTVAARPGISDAAVTGEGEKV